MSHFAITAQGTGERVGLRAIEPGWPLVDGETFAVELADDDHPQNYVLAEDGVSLRAPNAAEQLAEARTKRLGDLKRLRDAIQYDAYEWPADSGIWYQSSEISQLKIIGRSHAADSLRVKYPTMFLDADNNPQTFNSVEEILDWSATLHEFVSDCYVAAKALELEIMASPDPANFSLNTGNPWPKTRIDLTGV